MKNWRVWILTDKDGNELIRGQKKNVINLLYQRYVYEHIFTDNLYRTNEELAAAAKSSKKESWPEWEMAGYNGDPTKVKWNYD